MDPRIHRQWQKLRNYELLNLNMQDIYERYFRPMIAVYTRTMHEEAFTLGVNELLVSPQVQCPQEFLNIAIQKAILNYIHS